MFIPTSWANFLYETEQNLLYNKHVWTYMAFTTEGFFEVAIESWPERDLNT